MMNCPICGMKLVKNVKYCPGCGSLMQSLRKGQQPQTLDCTCKRCGGMMNYDPDHSLLICPYCDSREIVIEDEDVVIERIRSKALRELQQDTKKDRNMPHEEKGKKGKGSAKSGFLSLLFLALGILFFVLGAGAMLSEDYLCGILAFMQGALWIIARLLLQGRLSLPKISCRIVVIAALLLIIPFIAAILHTTGDEDYSRSVREEQVHFLIEGSEGGEGTL